MQALKKKQSFIQHFSQDDENKEDEDDTKKKNKSKTPWLEGYRNMHNNPDAWTADHFRDSNEKDYKEDSPKGFTTA